MNAKTSLLTYTQARDRQNKGSIRQTEVPIEHYVSLPMPTKRGPAPAYAFYASPGIRRAGQPFRIGAPDRWWMLDAHTGRTVLYSLVSAHPFANGATWSSIDLPPTGESVQQVRERLKEIEERMNALAPTFFQGEAGDAGERQALAQLLEAQIPEPLRPQHRALAPDFFAWLEG